MYKYHSAINSTSVFAITAINIILTQILSFGSDVEVLEPKNVREEIVSKIEEYKKKYDIL